MKNPKFHKYGSLVMILLSSILNIVVVNPLLKTKNELTTVTGIVTAQGQYVKYSSKGSVSNAINICITGYTTNFSIQEHVSRAYTYLSNNNIVGQTATILYNPSHFLETTNNKDINYNIYGLTIGNAEIMTMAEAKHYNYILFIFTGLFELLFICLFFYANSQAKKQRLSSSATENK